MKNGIGFFKKEKSEKLTESKKSLEIKLHQDGLTIGNRYSIRLSNIPKNISHFREIVEFFVVNIAISIKGVKASSARQEDCLNDDPHRIASNIYLNHSTESAFLWIKSLETDGLKQFLNNTCDFILADKQPGDYTQLGCFCSASLCTLVEACTPTYKAVLYGQNVSDNLKQCVGNFIDGYCEQKISINLKSLAMGLGGLIALLCLCCCVCSRTCISRISSCVSSISEYNRRPQEKSMIDLIELVEEDKDYHSLIPR